jgi:hypothetical protein
MPLLTCEVEIREGETDDFRGLRGASARALSARSRCLTPRPGRSFEAVRTRSCSPLRAPTYDWPAEDPVTISHIGFNGERVGAARGGKWGVRTQRGYVQVSMNAELAPPSVQRVDATLYVPKSDSFTRPIRARAQSRRSRARICLPCTVNDDQADATADVSRARSASVVVPRPPSPRREDSGSVWQTRGATFRTGAGFS